MNLRKSDLVAEICEMLSIAPVKMSTGSTEPRELFDEVVDVLGLNLPTEEDKIGVAKFIVESSGEAWAPHFESAGGTVTRSGLMSVRDAVRFFTSD